MKKIEKKLKNIFLFHFFYFLLLWGTGRPRGVLGLNVKNTNFQKKIEKNLKKIDKIWKKN